MRKFRWMLFLIVLFGLLLASIPAVFANIPLRYPTYMTTLTRGYTDDHRALDFPVPYRTRVNAAADGTVFAVYSGCHNVNGVTTGIDCSSVSCAPTRNFFSSGGRTFCNDSGGNVVILSHGGGVYTKYLHLDDSIPVRKGQSVAAGTLIAYSSGTGRSGGKTGYHLHFALCIGNTSSTSGIDPLPFLGGGSIPTEPVVTAANLDLTETSVYIRGYLDRSWLTNKASNPGDPYVVMLGVANSTTPNITDYFEYPPTVTNLTQFGKPYPDLTPGTTYYYRTMVRLSNGKQVVSPEGSYTTPGTAPGVKVTSINISGGSDPQTWLTKGRTRQLTADPMPADASNRAVTWSSSDPSRAQVNADGLVTGISPGSVDIIVTAMDGSGVTARQNFYILEVYVTKVTILPADVALSVGETFQLSAAVLPDDTADKNLVWSSTDTSIARVDESGGITAVGVGTATILAVPVVTDTHQPRGVCTVTVSPAKIPVSSVQLDTTAFSLVAGQSRNVAVRVLPADASNQALAWSSSNAQVATVDNGGNVLAVGPGSCTITVAAQDGSDATATIQVTVSVPVTGVSVTPTQMTLLPGQEGSVLAQIVPANASQLGKSWSSSNPAVATVDPNTGLVRAIAPGAATITVTTTDGGFTASCNLTVYTPEPAKIRVSSVSLSPASLALTEGDSGELHVTVSPDNATDKNLSWTSSNSAVAMVNQLGTVTAVAEGQAAITATAQDGSGKSSSVTVTVARKAPELYIDEFKALESSIAPYATATWFASAQGGVQPLSFRVQLLYEDAIMLDDSGMMPVPGNTFTFDAVLPMEGSYSVQVTVRDAQGATASMRGALVQVSDANTVPGDEVEPVVILGSLEEDVLTWQVKITGGTPPYTFQYAWYVDMQAAIVSEPTEVTTSNLNISRRGVAPGEHAIVFEITDATGNIWTKVSDGIAVGDPSISPGGEGLPGDADANESVDVEDLATMIDRIIDWIEPASFKNADVVIDGQIDIEDLIKVINMIVK